MTKFMSCSINKIGEAAAAQRLQQCGKRSGLGRIHSGRGLVEQQQLRIRRQRAGDLKPPLVAVSERGRELILVILELDEAQQLARPRDRRPLFGTGRAQPQHGRGPGDAEPHMPAGQHVLQDGHFAEQTQVLKCAAKPQGNARIGPQRGDIPIAEVDRTLAGSQQPRDQIEERRLAGAVRPDQRVHGAGRDHEGEVVDGHQAGEPAADTVHL